MPLTLKNEKISQIFLEILAENRLPPAQLYIQDVHDSS